jgi:hypothetical protein
VPELQLPTVSRRGIVGVCALTVSLLWAPVARAAPSGTIEGRVLNGAGDKPEPGVEVVLTGARPSGSDQIVRRAKTDQKGRFEFKNVPTGKRIYAVDASFDGGFFAGGAIELPAGTAKRPVVKTTLRVWDTISDPNAILIRRNDIFLSTGKQAVDVVESVTVVNTSRRAYIGRAPPKRSAEPRPTLGLDLPSGADRSAVQILDSSIDVPGLTPTDFGIGITAAVPPGETLITFAYRLPGSAGVYDFAKTALYPILNTSVHAADPLTIRSNRLVDNGEVTVGGTRYRRWSTTEALDPGDQLQVAAVAEARSSPGLGAGIVIAAVLAVGLLLWAFIRRRRPGPAVKTAGTHPVPETREHLVSLIAALDLRHRAGDVSEEEWARRRAELKQQLAELQTAEPTP